MVYLSSSPDKLCLQSFTIILTRHSMFELQHKPPMFAPPLPPGHHHNQMPLSSSEIMAIPTWPSGYSFLYEKKKCFNIESSLGLRKKGRRVGLYHQMYMSCLLRGLDYPCQQTWFFELTHDNSYIITRYQAYKILVSFMCVSARTHARAQNK